MRKIRGLGVGGAVALMGVLLAATGCAVPPPPPPTRTVYQPVYPAPRAPVTSAILPPYRPQQATLPTPVKNSPVDITAETDLEPVVAPVPAAAAAIPVPKAATKTDSPAVPRPTATAVMPAADNAGATPISSAPQPRARVPLGGFRPLPTYGNATTGS